VAGVERPMYPWKRPRHHKVMTGPGMSSSRGLDDDPPVEVGRHSRGDFFTTEVADPLHQMDGYSQVLDYCSVRRAYDGPRERAFSNGFAEVEGSG
jgi:hypothetical protein